MKKTRRKSRVLFLESGLGYGGSASFLHYFLKKLNSQVFDATVAFYHQNDCPHRAKMEALGVPVVSLGVRSNGTASLVPPTAPSDWTSVWRRLQGYGLSIAELSTVDLPLASNLAHLMREMRTDLVVLNNDIQYHLSGVIAGRSAGIPCICRKAGIGSGEKVKKVLARLVDRFIASSRAAVEDYLNEGLMPERLSMIYEGVDLREFTPDRNGSRMREELGIGRDSVVMGSVARLSAGKGHLGLLESAASILRAREDVILLIVGDAPGSEGKVLSLLKRKSTELGVRERVVFTGWRDDIPDLLSVMDIYVQNSVEPEGLGIAAVEAAAMGRPMVVTDAGGLRETVVDGESGYVVGVGNVEMLGARMNQLIESENLRQRMGREAREHAKRRFDLGRLMADYEREFLGVLGRNGTSA